LDIELRVATIPSQGGVEDVVMRILASGEPLPLEKMGSLQRNNELIKSTVSKPYGLFFVCGPTGSGKTTTLHPFSIHQQTRHQDMDRGRPGRNYPEGLAPGADQQKGRAGFCHHHARLLACRSGRDHGR